MKFSLIDQYCEAMESWAARGHDVMNLTHWTMFHCGGMFFVQPEGFMPHPDGGHILPLESGKYTVTQVHHYLNAFVGQSKILESTLISGLVRTIEVELMHLADYEGGVEHNRQEIEQFMYLYEHFDEIPEQEIEAYKQAIEAVGSDKPFDREFFKNLADVLLRSLDDPDNNAAERMLALTDWRDVSTPIVEFQNLHKWLLMHLHIRRD